ncbi:hypothetical protein [Hymenobacter sp.]|jgi:hypothetical protein|uniref:hypothetical protein n=1 Tax=Hymenobacter sp. TaxID=1898978 RepID=UPI002EDA28B3
MAQLFEEGNLQLSFPDGWAVIKYDKPGSFYQKFIKPIGADLTAVDFVAATPDQRRLWLIEVKEFRGHEVENRKRVTSGELGVEVMSNFLDTLAGLYVGLHGRQQELEGLADAFRNPDVEIYATLLIAADPLPTQKRNLYKQLPPNEQKRLDAELKWRGDLLQKLKVRLKQPFRFSVFLFDHDTIEARYGWTARVLPSSMDAE